MGSNQENMHVLRAESGVQYAKHKSLEGKGRGHLSWYVLCERVMNNAYTITQLAFYQVSDKQCDVWNREFENIGQLEVFSSKMLLKVLFQNLLYCTVYRHPPVFTKIFLTRQEWLKKWYFEAKQYCKEMRKKKILATDFRGTFFYCFLPKSYYCSKCLFWLKTLFFDLASRGPCN